MKPTILVVGGAGYIGSHMVKLLLKTGYQVITFDNLSTGYRQAVVGGEFILGDLAEPTQLTRLFQHYPIDAVMHFASFSLVGESTQLPGKYYLNNVANTLNLLEAMITHQIKTFIFSSTAAIFGEPQTTPIDENHPKNPINPYGISKWMIEQILQDYDKAHQLKSICLRYFNAAGADAEGELGENHNPETHLIPLVLQVASERRSHINIFGQDYETDDGTCVRDYIHIEDICQAHLLALQQLQTEKTSHVYNLGSGSGFSVQQVITAAREITGQPIPVTVAPRRQGDPAHLVADSRRAQTQLGWQPHYPDLKTIIQHAWQWEQKIKTETRWQSS